MEVTTIFPSAISPTEGDDLCETDVTSVAIHSVTLLICLCGLAGNGAVLWLLGSRCSSRNGTTRCILVLTFLDSFVLLFFLLPSTLLFLLEDMSCSFIMPFWYMQLLFWMSLLSYSLWLYTLTSISIKRCRSIHCPLWHCCHHPQHLLKVMRALHMTFFISLIPISIFIVMTILVCTFNLSEYCRVSRIFMYAFNILCALFMVISSTILFIHFKPGSHQQQPKTLNIVICLIVLFTLPFSLCNFLEQLSYTIVSSEVVFLLTCIYSSIKPFIYFLVGSCWRPCSMESLWLSLQRMFEEPEENTVRRDHPSMDTGV